MQIFLVLSVILLFSGAYTIVVKKNFIKILIGIELMLMGSNLAFIVVSNNSPVAQGLVIISLLIGTVFSAAGTIIAISMYRKCKTLDMEECKGK